MRRHKPGPGSTLILVFLCLLLFGGTGELLAQEDEIPEVKDIHWAFANQLGTGIYRIGENNRIYVVSLQPRFYFSLTPERPDPERHIRLQLSLPFSVGIHTFKWPEILQGHLPNRIRQLSFSPKVGLEIPVSRRWSLLPQIYFGWGKLLEEDGETAWIYGADIKSRFKFMLGHTDLYLLNGLVYSGHTSNKDRTEDMVTLMNGLEGHIPLGKLSFQDHPLFLKAHIINYWLIGGIEYLFHSDENPTNLGGIWEFGVGIGAKKKTRLWIFSLDRIGISFHFGRGAKGAGVFFSSRFYK